jgi:hypothetical protein
LGAAARIVDRIRPAASPNRPIIVEGLDAAVKPEFQQRHRFDEPATSAAVRYVVSWEM